MNFKVTKRLPSTEEIIQAFPLSDAGFEQVAKDKQEIKDILSGKDNRMLVIVGPCSAWPYEGVLKYAEKLSKLKKKVDKKLKLVMRLYIQKPRTTKGWTGPVNQPDPFSKPDIIEGIKYSRSIMVKVIEMGLPIADEAVFTHNAKGFIELLSWVAIGARSTEDQEHRIFASLVDCPVGMKNPTSGTIEIGVNSIVSAQNGHTAVFDGAQVETAGNPFAHLVLRGGIKRPNYHVEDIYHAQKLMLAHKLKNPAIIIDASHDNCKIEDKKDPLQQVNVVREVMASLSLYPDLRGLVKGFMLESFLKTGSQKVESLGKEEVDIDGLSITDPCLGWDETEKLILNLADAL
ncbi:MAG: 3-deoxy-7-phosphoheptulonate synthase [Candidatus Gracilibacteria bacterium]|jgi:3-deoxy-7-phosphoheptulonate synthase